jgi:PAS domain S-box-containing protein
VDKPDGHICYDVIKKAKKGIPYIVKDLQKTSYCRTDPNVAKYGLKTYIGFPVSRFKQSIGSICIVYQEDVDFDDDAKKIMGIIAEAISKEEERKKADDELRESEEKWRSLVENAPNIILIVDREGIIQFINRTIPGIKIKDAVGKHHLDYVEPEYREVVEKIINNVFQKGEAGTYEIRGTGPRGSVSWYEAQVGPIRRDDEVVAATIITTDITERKQATDILKESEKELRAIFDGVHDGILLADMESKEFYAGNDMICQMLGYCSDEVKKLRVMDIHPKENLSYVIEQFEKQAKKEISLARDIPVKRKDGSVFYADINSAPITLDGKRFLMGVFRDITDRKEAEEELRRTSEQLSVMLNSLPIICYTCKASGNYGATYISESVANVAGYKAEDFTSKASFWADRIHPDDKQKVFADLRNLSKTGHHEHEYRFRIADGSYRWFHDILNLVKSSDGTPSHIVGVWNDITERKTVELELQKQRGLLDATNKDLNTKVDQLQEAMKHIKRLEGLVPICAKCKKVRIKEEEPYDSRSWVSLEQYISQKTDASLTHGFCPDCAKKLSAKSQKKKRPAK